jgi:hypothetical protein
MARMISEKILVKTGGKAEVSPGEHVFLTSPCPVSGIGRGGPPIEAMGAMGARFFDPNMAIMMDGHAGAGGCLDVTNPVINDMSMDRLFSICNDALHGGGKTGIVPPDQ